jgi:hypothetical protein
MRPPMDFTPDETTWMGYLYGELDPETHRRVMQYLSNNPTARLELEQFASLRQKLNMLGDKTPPPLSMPERRKGTSILFPTFPKAMQYAATLVIALVCLMVAARATELHIRWSTDGLSVGFGNVQIPPTFQIAATSEGVEDSGNIPPPTSANSSVDSGMNHVQQTLDRELDKRFQLAKEDWINQIGPEMERRMDAYFLAVREEQALQLATYWEEVALAQKQYTEVLLQDFSQTLQLLREEDLVFLLERLNGIQYENEQRQQEINDLLIFLLAESDTSKPKQP